MAKLKMNQRVPNKNADFLKKISLMGTETSSGIAKVDYPCSREQKSIVMPPPTKK